MPLWPIDHACLAVLTALLVDAAGGDPRWLYHRLSHPVALLGFLIERLDRRFNRAGDSVRRHLAAGFLTAAALTLGAALAGAIVRGLTTPFEFGWLVEGVLASSLLAFRGLYDHVRAVGIALGENLQSAREAAGRIVGRDTASLDRTGVARAGVESLAENFSDGLVAPVFWYLVLGLPGLCAYKTINTLDSMLGHRTVRHEHFGKAAARLDDAANWLPARLAGVLLVAAAALVPGTSGRTAWRAMWRDAPRHRSVNAGWQEAPVAGALGIALAGPRRYAGREVPDAWMGAPGSDPASTVARPVGVEEIHAALRLYLTASIALAGLTLAVCLVH